MRGTIRLGSLLGIPIGVDLSWFLSLFWVLSILGFRVYPDILPRENMLVHWALAGVTGLIFFVCIILHELGHSVVARYFDIPVRSITLFVLGGVAQITRDATRPLPELLMALAGPAVSILLGGVFMLLWFVTGEGSNPASTMFWWLWVTNIFLGIFNLAPVFPMDGGRVLRASLWGVTHSYGTATRIAVWIARVVAWGLVGYGFVSILDLEFVPNPGLVNGIWMLLIGFFLLQNANASLRQTRQHEELAKHRVGDLMLRDVRVVLATTTVREMLLGPLAGYGQRDWLFVSGGEQFAGLLERAAVLRVPEEQWDTARAADLMLPAATLHPLGPEATLVDVLQLFQEHDVTVLPVVDQGEVAGIVHEGILNRLLEPKVPAPKVSASKLKR